MLDCVVDCRTTPREPVAILLRGHGLALEVHADAWENVSPTPATPDPRIRDALEAAGLPPRMLDSWKLPWVTWAVSLFTEAAGEQPAVSFGPLMVAQPATLPLGVTSATLTPCEGC